MISVYDEVAAATGIGADALKRKMAAIEQMIRQSTNNPFANKFKRLIAASQGGFLLGVSPYIGAGDSVVITGIGSGSGLYVVERIENGKTVLDPAIPDAPVNVAMRVEYPPDLIDGANAMLEWDFTYRGKAGIRSETIARHSVTYADQDAYGMTRGYPASLVAFLRRYTRAKF